MVQIDLRVRHLKIDMYLGVGLVQYAELVLDDIECVHEKSSIICDTESFSERKLPENCAGESDINIISHNGEKVKGGFVQKSRISWDIRDWEKL